ncbi:hypothetical protein [Chromobacterium sp. LK1]|uniref:hypothetical protein n=1 Tax=Chromobacterium sp. LK1 TaxID=1628193 RepID=UPI000A5C3707|nr:hypothetical protein [Chromobacterium sp. LK1]
MAWLESRFEMEERDLVGGGIPMAQLKLELLATGVLLISVYEVDDEEAFFVYEARNDFDPDAVLAAAEASLDPVRLSVFRHVFFPATDDVEDGPEEDDG